jgi:hypothetical protein
MEGLFGAGREAQLEVLPSPRLMHTHMHHALLPPSLAHNPDCKIVYVCRYVCIISYYYLCSSLINAAAR